MVLTPLRDTPHVFNGQKPLRKLRDAVDAVYPNVTVTQPCLVVDHRQLGHQDPGPAAQRARPHPPVQTVHQLTLYPPPAVRDRQVVAVALSGGMLCAQAAV